MVIKYGKDVPTVEEWSIYEDKGEIYIGFMTANPNEIGSDEVLVRLPAAQARIFGKRIINAVDEASKLKVVK